MANNRNKTPISITINRDLLAKIDQVRSLIPRSAFIEKVIRGDPDFQNI